MTNTHHELARQNFTRISGEKLAYMNRLIKAGEVQKALAEMYYCAFEIGYNVKQIELEIVKKIKV